MVDEKMLLDKFSFIKIDEPLKFHCTFKIGGNAKIFAEPRTIDELLQITKYLNSSSQPYRIIGNGSNILFLDAGTSLTIISTSKMKGVKQIDETSFEIVSGESLSGVAFLLSKLGFTGLEFAVGIPGTVGGAVVMNAGAFGSDISKVIQSVTYLDGNFIRIDSVEDCRFGYRCSKFLTKKDIVIISVRLNLTIGNTLKILKDVNCNIEKRKETQPLGRSAGSVFKRTETQPAGKLIDECGLKGKKIGGAIISNKHANFILNANNATSKDVLDLIDFAKQKVKEKFNEQLELEIEIIE